MIILRHHAYFLTIVVIDILIASFFISFSISQSCKRWLQRSLFMMSLHKLFLSLTMQPTTSLLSGIIFKASITSGFTSLNPLITSLSFSTVIDCLRSAFLSLFITKSSTMLHCPLNDENNVLLCPFPRQGFNNLHTLLKEGM